MTALGRWPGRRFILGPPAAVIVAVAFALVAGLALVLS
jgi:hypothetical protein